jgi:adenosylhomocysteine nucleosidase
MTRRELLLAFASVGCGARTGGVAHRDISAVVVVSANAEWKVVAATYPDAKMATTPWGPCFERAVDVRGRSRSVVFLHGGWGKVAASGSAQYAIDRWRPRTVINLGTCGGFAGRIEKHDVILVDRTIIYDIVEAMGDPEEAIAAYSVTLDLSWLRSPLPRGIRKTLLVSGDRDLAPSQIADLAARYGAVAGDWESGAIAYACARNRQRLLILRGVTDLVSESGGTAYGNEPAFADDAAIVMRRLLSDLPDWLERCS